MTKKDQAVSQFMYQTLETLYPHWREYPFQEMRAIEDQEVDESETLENNYAEHILRAYWMKRALDDFDFHSK